jgi:membrane-associated phospholipid phosphatase
VNDGRIFETITWAVIGVVGVAAAFWIAVSDFAFDVWGASRAMACSLVLAALLWFYRRRRPDECIAAALVGVLQLILFAAGTGTLSYLLASLAYPFWDETFFKWDLALGLDWRAYLAFVNDRPWLGRIYTLTYSSILPQMSLACVVLGLTGRLYAMRLFVTAAAIAGVVTVLMSSAMPAMAMFVHLGLQPSDYPNLAPAAAHVHVAHMEGLRDGTFRVISLQAGEGLIAFPSYHAALGVLLLVAFWAVPWLRWPGCIVNLLMIAATPIDGGHYFVDVFAGIAVAVLTLLALHAYAARRAPAADEQPQGIAVRPATLQVSAST